MNNELLAIISYLERDRGVAREVIIQAIENAIQHAALKSLNVSPDFKVQIDRKKLTISAYDLLVVSDTEDGNGFVSLRRARAIDPGANVGDTIRVPVSPERLGRIAAQTAKQGIMQKIREAERQKVYEEYKDRIGDIVSGTVKLISHRDVIVELGKTEAILPAKERIPTEEYNVGDMIRAYVQKVQHGANGPSVVLSRTCPEFLKALFRMEVAEIADGIVEVVGVARDPGFRAKIAVRTLDSKIDPVGACVGVRGARVRNIVRELNGEKIDIVRWQEDIHQYIIQALTPARLKSVEVDPDSPYTVHVAVEPDQFSLAVGKRGQNARLTSRLTGWRVDIYKAGEESFETQRLDAIEHLSATLNITAELAEHVVDCGFLTTDGILATELSYFQEVTELEPEVAEAIWNTAQEVGPEDGAAAESGRE